MIVMVAAVAGVLVAATMDDSLDTQWAWTLISAIAIGYMLSRGLAKSGNRHHEA
jgi:di/tricarboxylate transporter